VNRQKEILNKIAKAHGLSIAQATEVWDLFIDKAAATISDPDKKTDGEYDVEKFKTIHIDNFGKFIPNVRNIRHANMCLKKKDDRHEE
jgi:nucleoid DNA-binding protein